MCEGGWRETTTGRERKMSHKNQTEEKEKTRSENRADFDKKHPNGPRTFFSSSRLQRLSFISFLFLFELKKKSRVTVSPVSRRVRSTLCVTVILLNSGDSVGERFVLRNDFGSPDRLFLRQHSLLLGEALLRNLITSSIKM